jgi:hypothetical protein
MRQLRSCDFCDAEAGLGVYEVVPDHLDGVEQRRLVLCPDCRDRLDWVLEPFRDALDGAAGDVAAGAGEDVTLLGVSESTTADESTDEEADAGDPSADEPAPDEADAGDPAATDESTDAQERDPDPSAAPAGRTTAERAADDTPPKYRQVMRFLGNRELPIDRMEAESLAAGAYDIEADEAADIIDTAVERGLLVEDDGQLRSA